MKLSKKYFIFIVILLGFGPLCSGMDLAKKFVIARADLYLKINQSSLEKVAKVNDLLDNPAGWYARYMEKTLDWNLQLEETKFMLSHNNVPFREGDISGWGKAMQKQVHAAKAAVLRALLDILPHVAANNFLSPLCDLPCLGALLVLCQLSREQLNESFLSIYENHKEEINLFFTELLKIRKEEGDFHYSGHLSLFQV